MTLYSRAETQAQSIKVLNTTEKASVKKYESDGTLVAHDGNTNATAGAEGNAAIQSRVVFIDEVEATLAENRERGLTAPGWWQYTSYTDADGNTRHKCQHLVAFKGDASPANTADADDAVAADVASAITIGTQPADQTGVADPFTDAAAFSVVATATTGSLLYQWQRQTAGGTRWTNITDGAVFAGSNGPDLAITGADKATYDGYKFRVKITTDAGAEEVISDAATLTFA
jgi:hypothetical protein